MSGPLLLKGFEVEAVHRQRQRHFVVGDGRSMVAAALPGFVTKPDHRNLELHHPPRCQLPPTN